MKPFRRKTIFCYCFCRSVIVWQDGNVTFYSTTTTPLIWKRDRMSCRRKTPQLHSTIPNILRDISVFAVCFPCHPCTNTIWIPDNSLGTCYSLSDVIFQQITAGYATGVHSSGRFAIITPVAAIDLKYPIIGASASGIVVCSLCVIITFPFGQTHPVGQADTSVAT